MKALILSISCSLILLGSIGHSQDISHVISIIEVDTIMYNGPKDNRVNFALQNRGVDNPNQDFQDKEEFLDLFRSGLLGTFTEGDPLMQAPYAQYRDFFNLFSVWWPEAPSETEGWSFQILKAVRDSLFLPWSDPETGWATLFSVTRHGGGGGAGLERDRRVGDGKLYGMGWETILHEFGHTMPGLPDEYSASGVWSNSQCWESGNTTGYTILDEIPWRLWIEQGTPLPTPYTEEYLNRIGAFEGALTNFFGCHRPTARGCYMGAGGFGEDYGQELCSPCIQRVICYLYNYVNPIESFFPAETDLEISGSEIIHFSTDLIKPEPNTQKYQWILNGREIARGVEEIELRLDSCENYELIFALTDTNNLIRYDPKFEDTYPKPYREIRWNIHQSKVEGYDLEADYTAIPADCTGEDNGQLQFSVSGGRPPYHYTSQSSDFNNPLSGLAAGDYTFSITDANGCGITEEVEIDREPVLDPDIQSSRDGDSWALSLVTDPYNTEELLFLWSNGAETPEVSGLPDGDYSVEITTATGCIVERSVSLRKYENQLAADHKVFQTAIGQSTGAIYLEIEGGVSPYSVEWMDRENRDISSPDPSRIQASGTTWGHLPEFAFDDDLQTKWLHFVSENAWITQRFDTDVIVHYYTITSADDVPDRDPKDWLFQGSENGIDWITLDQQTNHSFGKRFEKKAFLLQEPASFGHYRLFIQDNHGDGSIQLQELEIIGSATADEFLPKPIEKNNANRLQLHAGEYIYSILDANHSLVRDTVIVGYGQAFHSSDLQVIQSGDCGVRIEFPDPNLDYYWLSDEAGTTILHTGPEFSPTTTGNYYVAASLLAKPMMSSNKKGFAVNLPEAPLIELVEDSILQVMDPDPDLIYRWYDQESCGSPLHTGSTFLPVEEGFYYAAAFDPVIRPAPVHPDEVEGMVIRMDASDLDGDGVQDDPAPATSSLLRWEFENGNGWHDGSWYAFRSNIQNGLGIADFATIWLQRIRDQETGYQTIVMAYEENPISFPNTAPFEGLSVHIPKGENSQLFSDDSPASTLEGTTFLNGEIVNPLIADNPFTFSILACRMSEPSSRDIFYTDTKWEGRIGELILWDHGLNDEQILGLSEYLRKKWISTADLESTRTPFYWDKTPVHTTFQTADSRIILFPNPCKDHIRLEGLNKNEIIRLMQLDGSVLQSWIAYQGHSMVIDLETLVPGPYIISIEDPASQRRTTKKFIKLQ